MRKNAVLMQVFSFYLSGGAMLVSPQKTKNTSRAARRSEAPLGKAHSPYRHLNQDSPVEAPRKVLIPSSENGQAVRC